MSYEDKTLQCRECGVAFVFTMGEQEFFAERGLMNEPGRCPTCRAARKRGGAGMGMGTSAMRTGPREMHPVVCAACGTDTQVPFLPRNDKPVYCSNCFDKVRGR